MDMLRCVRFDDLPASVREGLTQAVKAHDAGGDGPIAMAFRRTWGDTVRAALWALPAAALLVATLYGGFGQLTEASVQHWAQTAWYAALLAFVLVLPLSIWPVHHRPRLPFRPGVYIMPSAIVDARSPFLDIHPMAGLRKFDIRHMHQGKKYSHTVMAVVFSDGRAMQHTIAKEQQVAEAALASLRNNGAALQAAAAAGDLQTLRRLDPLFELRAAGTPRPARSTAWQRAAQQLLASPIPAALVLGFVLAQPVWLARNLASDSASFRLATSMGTEAAYQQYVKIGWRFTAEAKAAMPAAALKDAIKVGTVAALRGVLQRYPASGFQQEVAARVSKIYQDAFERFKVRARGDPELVPFVQKLLQHLEKSGDSTIAVRFVRRDTSELQRFDQRDLRKFKVVLAPVSGHFGDAANAGRESRIVGELGRGFRSVFPEDVLKLVQRAQAAAGRPTLEIDYLVKPSGSVYTSELTQLNFVGIVYRFDMRFDVTTDARPWHSTLEVLPPQRFQVRSTGSRPTDGTVYAEMADRAFDFLGEKLRTAFFGPPAAAK
jgi:hypothetical protein